MNDFSDWTQFIEQCWSNNQTEESIYHTIKDQIGDKVDDWYYIIHEVLEVDYCSEISDDSIESDSTTSDDSDVQMELLSDHESD